MNAVKPLRYPMSLEAALDGFLVDRLTSATWRRVRRATDMPWPFEQLACTLPANSWIAYTDGTRTRFVTGSFVGPPRRETGCPDLAVNFHDPSGVICARGVWRAYGSGQWILHETQE